ncbi:hypothetical protein IQ283_14040 [Alkalihalobacillus hwajinpoensis]|uniref:LPO_1073/Vpar_1526 family protein n=1 Tax=Guptibacillus hwajinpoensis TaxID=208199 RepID=UPI0018846E67|nr:LPO_1073/Vpar_1526 family protein [Pseudalkalibacillus hwajinpoensis]MBF0707713.1 hypothetical protein [Pseudalkalibacillus hwajinpoensis]
MKQKSGDNSTNYQAETMNIGVSADEARNIAIDVFKSNFLDLSQQAADLATTRAERLVNDYLEKLSKQYPDGIEKMKNPDMQYALFEAQKEYARTGNDNLEEMLVNILVERTKENDMTLKKIVLDESLKILPKLTQLQIDILSLSFFCKKVGFNYQHKNSQFANGIFNIYLKFINPFSPFHIPFQDYNLFEHLVYTGAARLSIGEISFEKLLKNKYPNIFSDFDEKEVSQMIDEFHPNLKEIKNTWNSTNLKHMEITSVGLAIGHANLTKKCGIDTNLSIWIS